MLTLLRLAGIAAARRCAHASPSARRDRRRGDVREPGAAGAVRRRDCGRRRRGADSVAAARRSRAHPIATICCGGWPANAASTSRRSTTCSYARRRHHRGVRAARRHRCAAGREEGGAEDDRGGRSAGDDHLHARDRVRLALPRGSGARLRQPVPLLLGRLQLPAGARVSEGAHPAARASRRAPIRTASGSCRSRCAITRTSKRS